MADLPLPFVPSFPPDFPVLSCFACRENLPMKWIYVIILVAIVGAIVSDKHLRSFIIGNNPETPAKSEETSGVSRVSEMDAASEASRSAGK